jgi:hypothetical protein
MNYLKLENVESQNIVQIVKYRPAPCMEHARLYQKQKFLLCFVLNLLFSPQTNARSTMVRGVERIECGRASA